MTPTSNTYIDTRGLIDSEYTFSEAIVEGMAPGGGLFVPVTIPELSVEQICSLAELAYAERAAFVYKCFGVDMGGDVVDSLMQSAYGDNFDDAAICPIREVDEGMYVMELWHGPTSAFKDMALQCLPRFFAQAAEDMRSRGEEVDDHLILVATSGDTGKAALEGFRDLPHTRIIVFYPDGGVSDVQYAQMATQRGANVGVFGARGNFDDCQTSVKKAFGDEAFAHGLEEAYGVKLSSANSINWGRLLPQVVYYVSGYADMVARGAVQAGAPIDVCVPTGNFGNILAAWYARRIGTPIKRLLCASNENRVLTDFINTGTYDISDREFVLTPSPSMDILVSSNLERQLFELTGRDASRIRKWMSDLSTQRCFRVDKDTFSSMRDVYAADCATSSECFDQIRETYERHHYLLDPHTAVAYRVATRLMDSHRPVLIASTAHWAKFGANVYRALNGIEPGGGLPADIAQMHGIELNEHISRTYDGAGKVPSGLAELAELPLRFTEVVDGDKDGVEDCVRRFLEV